MTSVEDQVKKIGSEVLDSLFESPSYTPEVARYLPMVKASAEAGALRAFRLMEEQDRGEE